MRTVKAATNFLGRSEIVGDLKTELERRKLFLEKSKRKLRNHLDNPEAQRRIAEAQGEVQKVRDRLELYGVTS